MKDFETILSGGDLRSIGQSNKVASLIDNQIKFDKLFQLLFHPDRKIVMRTADAIEKITIPNPNYLKSHKKAIIALCDKAEDKELKWHLALLVSRLTLTRQELGKIWHTLTSWATNKKESRIVRVNSLQGLFNLLAQDKQLHRDFFLTISQVEKENIPSLIARIKKFKNAIEGVNPRPVSCNCP